MYPSLLLGVALAVGAPAPKAEAKKEPATPVGTWVGVKAVAGGMDLPVPDGGIEFTLTADGQLFVKEGPREKPEAGSYKLDAKKEPAEIDLVPPAGKNDPTILGIYKLDGDTLTLCFGKGRGAAAERPKAFESPAGAEVIVITMTRKKDKDKPKE
jgi:uncharacterized protein (TIGR03067 family)